MRHDEALRWSIRHFSLFCACDNRSRCALDPLRATNCRRDSSQVLDRSSLSSLCIALISGMAPGLAEKCSDPSRLDSVKILSNRPFPLPPSSLQHSVAVSAIATNRIAPLSSSKRSVGLGVNAQTGRVQWCPGFTCCKLLVILPVVMLPITFVLILLMRMDSVLLALHLPPSGTSLAAAAPPVASESAMWDDGTAAKQLRLQQLQQIQQLQDQAAYIDDFITHLSESDATALEVRAAEGTGPSPGTASETERESANTVGTNDGVSISNEGGQEPQQNHMELEQSANSLTDTERLRRCISFKFNMGGEAMEVEDHDIMKDARTSFLPSDTTIIPRECLEFLEHNHEADDNGPGPDDDDYDNDSAKRSRRTSDDSVDTSSEPETDTDGVFAAESLPDLAVQNGDGDASLFESALQSFWNEQGNRISIRRTQAKTMRSYMDITVDPCVDFYQYACGNWAKLHPIPRDKAGYDTFEMLRESLDSVLKKLLESDENELSGSDQHRTQETNNVNQQLKDEIPDVMATATIAAAINERPKAHETTQEEKLKERTAQLRRHIVERRETLSHILMRYRRQTTNTKRKRLISFFGLGRTAKDATPHFTQSPARNAREKAKYLYQSCTNMQLLLQRGTEPLLRLIGQLGGWPVLNPRWDPMSFDWLNLTAQLRRYNNDILLVQWVGPDIKNSDENVIQFDQTSLGLPTREYFLQPANAKYLQAYERFMAEVMGKLGAPDAMARRTANELIVFETKLASITSPAELRLNVTKLYKRMTVHRLHNLVPEINWQRYLSILQQRAVANSEEVVVYAMDYMQELVSLLVGTEPRTVANYLMWRFVRHRINNVDDRFEETKQSFYHALFGREESPSRWKVCIAQVNTNMGMALGSMFVRKYFDETSKRDTLRMTHELQQAFRDILKTTDWIDAGTKHLAELKVNAMSLKIGYPDFILNPNELDEKYAGIEIHPDRYFENTLNVLLHTTQQEQKKLHEPVNKTTWQTAPAIVNAYYSRNKNQIMFPAGILQPPFYHRHFPRSLNFGGIGVVIGHELTHGFDDKGRLFDRNGSIHKWWSDSAIREFDERARCIIAQYSNYTVNEVGIALNGESTQGENIADNGGIRQAFHAYKRWLRDNPEAVPSERLPGIEMTGEQLFFLNFGQVWCGAMRPEAVRNKLNTAIHSPGRFRVIGTLSNSIDFAREYHCPLGSPMNPQNKCSVW